MLAAMTLLATGLFAVSVPAALADSQPVNPETPTTMTADPLPTVQINGVAWSQVVVGNTVYVAGSFTNARPAGAAAGVNTTPRSNLLAYDITTGNLITSWAPTVNAQALVIAASPDGSTIYVGGSFTQANGQVRSRIAAFTASTGALVANFRPLAQTTVRAIAVSDSTVYYGGDFSTVNGVARGFVAANSVATGALLAWNPNADSAVLAMTLNHSKSKLIFGGRFTHVGGQDQYGMSAVDPASGAVLPWAATALIRNAGTQAAVNSLTSDAEAVYGTAYHFGAGGNLEGLFMADNETGVIKWLEDCHGDTYDAHPTAGVVYVTGHAHYCGNIDGFPQTSPTWTFNHSLAFGKTVSGTITDDPYGYFNFAGNPHPELLHWYPRWTAGTFTGQTQAGWSITGSTDGRFVAYGGEFTAVSAIAQQGLVRFGPASAAPNKIAPASATTAYYNGQRFGVSAVSFEAGKARIGWTTTFDRDNQHLTYKVYRDYSVITGPTMCVQTADNRFWEPQNMGCVDTTAAPGSTHRYRVIAFDDFGNRSSTNDVTVTIATEATSSPYADAVRADNPTNFYRLSEPDGPIVYDWIGFEDLSAGSGVTRGAAGGVGDSNTASTFNGTQGQGVAAGQTFKAGPNTFTTEAWIKTTTTNGGKIIGFGNAMTGDSTGYDRHVYMDSSGRLVFGVYPGSVQTLSTSASYNDGQWHLVTASLGSNGMRLYVDGKVVGSRNDVTSGQDYSGVWRIGGDNLNAWPNQPNSSYFAGTIDDVAIYPTVLDKSKVAAHYAASGRTNPLPQPPVDAYGKAVFDLDPALFWRLDEASGTTAKDRGPQGNDGTLRGGVVLGQAGGLFGYPGTSAAFDGNDDFVASDTQFSNPKNYSVGVWVKTTSNSGGKLIGFGCSQTGTSGCYDRHIYMDNGGQVTFGVWTGFTNTITTPTALNDGQWHFVLATQSTSVGMKLFVDGALVGTNGQTDAQDYAGYWRVGGDNHWGCCSPFLAGTLDEAVVFDSVLTPAQVTNLYSLGSAPAANPAPVAVFTHTETNLAASFDASGSHDDGTIASYAWDFGDGATGTGVSPTHAYATAGTYTVELVVTDNGGAAGTISHSVTVTAPTNQSPVAAFTSDVSNLTAEFDASTSDDPDGTIASYAWNWGDGSTAGTGVSPTHAYAAAGNYTVELVVTDNGGATGTISHTVSVTAPANQLPTARFTHTESNLQVSVNGSTSSDPEGTTLSYAWDFGDSTTGSGVTTSHTYAAAGTYTVRLTVTDANGGTGTVTHDVTVTAPPTPGLLAQDTFGRTLATGWGSADTGGAWTLSGAANLFAIGGGAGTISVGAGKAPAAHLNSWASTSTDMTADLSVDKLPNAGSVYLGLIGRGDNANAYRSRVLIRSTGVVEAHLTKSVAGTESTILTTQVAGLTYTAGTVLHVRMQVTGSGTTSLKLKVWRDGTTEPSAWRLETTETTAALQVARGVGVRGYLSASTANGPVVFNVDNLRATTVA